MNIGKKIVSYIILALFTLFCGFVIFCTLEEAGFTRMFGWPLPALVGGICMYLLITAAVYQALQTLFRDAGRHIKNRKRLETVLAVVLPVLTILGVAVYLVFYLMNHIPIALQDDTFYSLALVRTGNDITYSVHGATRLYVCLLHGMLLVFGNTPFAGVVLQIILFFVCFILLYTGMQAHAGVISAAVATAAFGFFSISTESIFLLAPELSYLALYLLGFCITGVLYRKTCRSDKGSMIPYVLLFLAGLYAGFLVYLDLIGVCLYLFLAVCHVAGNRKIKQIFLTNLTALSGGICGFFLSAYVSVLFADNPAGGGNFAAGLSAFAEKVVSFYLAKISLPGNGILQLFPPYDPASFVVFLLLVSLSFFIVPAFFMHRETQSSIFILQLLLLYGLSCLGLTGLQGQMRGILCWCMLAGIGISGTFCLSEKLSAEKESEDIEMKDLDQTVINEKKKPAKAQEQEKPAPGKPLHNPLPVPTRKSRPQADFAFQVADDDMKFDVETADDDEFDF